jgi:3-oxoacyl-(acyl-carrier-protein) synthase
MTASCADIAVTGLAAISAAGVGINPLREALARGESLLRPVPAELIGGPGYLWGKEDCFKASDYMSPLKARKFDRCSLFAVVAAGMALRDAGVDMTRTDPDRVGILLGCGFGGIANSTEFLSGYFTQGADGLAPMLFPNTVPNAPASNASIELGIKGPNVTIVQRFCSAESAIDLACRFLKEERADIVVAGGVDDLTPYMLRAFKAMGQLRSHGAGFGEGSGLLVLEREEDARRRGVPIKGHIDAIRTVGLLLPGSEEEGSARLAGKVGRCDLLSLSGTAGDIPALAGRFPTAPRLETGKVVGRSLAMGGIALVSLLLSLPAKNCGLHLAASPEGPYYAIEVRGGAPA